MQPHFMQEYHLHLMNSFMTTSEVYEEIQHIKRKQGALEMYNKQIDFR